MPAVLDRVSNLLKEIGREAKTAATKSAMDDPGSIGGESSHVSVIPEAKANEQAPKEKEQTADNASIVKETVPNAVDSTSPATSSTSNDTDQQIGDATPTGEDPANEDDYKGTKEDGSIGGKTSHPANGDLGDKYANLTRDMVAKLSDLELEKVAADLGNALAADVANGVFSDKPAAPATKVAATKPATPAQAAAAAGYQAAAVAGNSESDMDKLAAAVIEDTVNTAHRHAVLVHAYIHEKMAKMAEDADDPIGGGAEGEDHKSDEGEAPKGPAADGSGESDGPPMAGGGTDPLLAAMAGGGGGGAPGGAPPADPMAGGGAPPGDPGAGGAPPPGGGAPGGMPPEMSGMSADQGLQHLAMALLELGIDPSALASAAGNGPGLAAKVASFKQSGKFHFSEAKTATDRKVRDFMKGYVKECMKAGR